MIGKYCGSTLPSSIMTSGRTLYLRFKTDASGVGNGFRANYQTIGASTYRLRFLCHNKSNFIWTCKNQERLLLNPEYKVVAEIRKKFE